MLGARTERSATADWSSRRVMLGTSSRPSRSLHERYGSEMINTRSTRFGASSFAAIAGDARPRSAQHTNAPATATRNPSSSRSRGEYRASDRVRVLVSARTATRMD